VNGIDELLLFLGSNPDEVMVTSLPKSTQINHELD